MIPGFFYTVVTCSYIMQQKIGFNLPWGAAYGVSAVFTAVLIVIVLLTGKKRAAAAQK